MQTNEFEGAFSNYLESNDCEEASGALFDIIRRSFLAGWQAARGEAPESPDKIIYLLHKGVPKD